MTLILVLKATRNTGSVLKMAFHGFYRLAIDRLKECNNSNGIIRFPDVFSKLCRTFSLQKDECWELLFMFRDLGIIEIVCGHGIRFLEKSLYISTISSKGKVYN